jgi:hypothetical protein
MTAQLARRRVMRARRETVCPICQRLIRPGDYIIRLGVWMHLHHVIDRLAATHCTEGTAP